MSARGLLVDPIFEPFLTQVLKYLAGETGGPHPMTPSTVLTTPLTRAWAINRDARHKLAAWLARQYRRPALRCAPTPSPSSPGSTRSLKSSSQRRRSGASSGTSARTTRAGKTANAAAASTRRAAARGASARRRRTIRFASSIRGRNGGGRRSIYLFRRPTMRVRDSNLRKGSGALPDGSTQTGAVGRNDSACRL